MFRHTPRTLRTLALALATAGALPAQADIGAPMEGQPVRLCNNDDGTQRLIIRQAADAGPIDEAIERAKIGSRAYAPVYEAIAFQAPASVYGCALNQGPVDLHFAIKDSAGQVLEAGTVAFDTTVDGDLTAFTFVASSVWDTVEIRLHLNLTHGTMNVRLINRMGSPVDSLAALGVASVEVEAPYLGLRPTDVPQDYVHTTLRSDLPGFTHGHNLEAHFEAGGQIATSAEGLSAPQGAGACSAAAGRCDAQAWFFDADADGHGGYGMSRMACDPGPGYAAQASDCNDARFNVHPDMPEIPGNGIDDNCDGISL